jgi:hypothetical protein
LDIKTLATLAEVAATLMYCDYAVLPGCVRLVSKVATMVSTFGQFEPHWLDEVIEATWREHDPRTIATAITRNEKLLSAIRQGLEDARRLPEMQPALNHAQCIRTAVLKAMKN